ncbi:MAG: indolepyruvate ferredoxin oxidoreductase subunit alpha [bacterium]|nr:indolepyruvate ferredoxin oxidoreductase subunit alpha [bacterium]
MIAIEGRRAIDQLLFGAGQTLQGDGALILTKALLENGVGYLGGYPGSPVAHLLDLFAEAYEPILRDMGIYVEMSNNEASAASLLTTSVTHPIRGAVCWKVVGTNVASDSLAHLAAAGVTGGVLIIVGEDYGCTGTTVAERTLPFGLKSGMAVVEPLASPPDMARLVKESFELSEASRMPVLYVLPTRVGNLKGSFVARENQPPALSTLNPLSRSLRDPLSITLPPRSMVHERQKTSERLPAARDYIRSHRVNRLLPGRNPEFGIIAHGAITNLVFRSLHLLGLNGHTRETELPILALRALYPLVSEELEEFVEGKRAVVIVEEGQPAILEDQIRSMLQKAGCGVALIGKDDLGLEGELEPSALMDRLGRIIGPRLFPSGEVRERIDATLERHAAERVGAVQHLAEPLVSRTPIFCTGCPERPIFTALKILEAEGGQFRYANDIGCYSLGALPPFEFTDSITAMGTGLATTGALSRLIDETMISFMGDGTFWHSGLTTSVINAVQNNTNVILVIFENFHIAMTGGQPNPSTGVNFRGEPIPKMDIEATLKACGVQWMRVVNPYDLDDSLAAFRAALSEPQGGLRVLLSRAECQLIKGRRDERQVREDLAKGLRVVQSQYGVDPDLCTGDHSCISLNGCPSLTLASSPNPLREHSIVMVDNSCSGCGLCGEITVAAKLCPSFYEVTVVSHPRWWERLSHALWRTAAGLSGRGNGLDEERP